MPRENRFAHQFTSQALPTSPYLVLQPPAPLPSDAPRPPTLQQAAADWRASGVTLVYLVHGTFAGDDAVGLLAPVARMAPRLGTVLRRWHKSVVDLVIGDTGNYTADYQRRFAAIVNGDQTQSIEIRRFDWSGQNNHLGRSDAAVRLISRMLEDVQQGHRRVVLWGHSHAGNVFALVSNLLAADPQTREEFFRAAGCYFRGPWAGRIETAPWRRVVAALDQQRDLVHQLELDIVTFGMPIRYGWDSGGFRRSLHFVNHIPTAQLAVYRAPFPPRLYRLLMAADGDFVQQIGIAGTNLIPFPLALRSVCADWSLDAFLQAGVSRRSIWKRLRAGTRVSHEGTTLLVDYGSQSARWEGHVFGHAVYTRERWLPFHIEEVARRWFSH